MDLPEDKLHRVADARVLRETERGGLLVDCDGLEVWIPRSQVDDKSEVWREGDEGELVIPLWLAEDRGLA